MWVAERETFLQSTDYGHDLNSATILLAKHEVYLMSCLFRTESSVSQMSFSLDFVTYNLQLCNVVLQWHDLNKINVV